MSFRSLMSTTATAASRPLVSAGFSKKQIRTASNKLGVIRRKGGFQGAWYWRLPGGVDPGLPGEMNDSVLDGASKDAAEGAQGAQKESWAALREKGTFDAWKDDEIASGDERPPTEPLDPGTVSDMEVEL